MLHLRCFFTHINRGNCEPQGLVAIYYDLYCRWLKHLNLYSAYLVYHHNSLTTNPTLCFPEPNYVKIMLLHKPPVLLVSRTSSCISLPMQPSFSFLQKLVHLYMGIRCLLTLANALSRNPFVPYMSSTFAFDSFIKLL